MASSFFHLSFCTQTCLVIDSGDDDINDDDGNATTADAVDAVDNNNDDNDNDRKILTDLNETNPKKPNLQEYFMYDKKESCNKIELNYVNSWTKQEKNEGT